MYKAVLENIAGVEIWPVIAIVIFMAIFIGVSIWAIRLDKQSVKKMAFIPLEETEKHHG